jgi:hypothetical protein
MIGLRLRVDCRIGGKLRTDHRSREPAEIHTRFGKLRVARRSCMM